ncbi:hypothetical protein [Pararobbsia alpina]|uniref:hypothetical protein n=1 Tax=Pararobbsia alpina TaxID=621374 RepID=UPI001581E9F8|nr:hypothetical protein [Pararobbsia alpina]
MAIPKTTPDITIGNGFILILFTFHSLLQIHENWLARRTLRVANEQRQYVKVGGN